MLKRSRTLLNVALSLAIISSLSATLAWAGEAPPPNTGALSLTIVLNMPTSYYFRGIAQSNAGVHLQPYLELKANLYEGGEKDALTAAYVKVAGFSHFQSIAPPITTNYYEQDVYLTGGLTLVKRFTLEGGWNLYTYPGIGSAAQVQEVFGKLSVDDGGLWPFKLPGDQDFSLSPYLLVARETSGGADGAGSLGGGHGTYLEMEIDPGLSVNLAQDWPVRFHLPLTVGLSLDKYYEVATATGVRDKTFGFADLGFAVDIPLKFMPGRYGKWTFSAGPHLLWLGQNTRLPRGPRDPGSFAYWAFGCWQGPDRLALAQAAQKGQMQGGTPGTHPQDGCRARRTGGTPQRVARRANAADGPFSAAC
jgi:hypothetical protein